jgi:drug/metabolite transporter (DMT)-like permease
MSSPHRTMAPAEWAMLLGLSVLWGGSFFFTGVALRALPPLTLVLLRVSLAAALLNVAVPLLGVRMPLEARVWGAFLVMGLLNNVVPFCLIVWSQTAIASGLAAILNATTPLAGVLVAHALTDEKVTPRRLGGVLAGLTGVIVVVGPAALQALGTHLAAQLAVLCAAVSYALAGIFGRRFQRLGVAPLATAAGQVSASTLLLFPLALLIDRPWTLAMPGADIWSAVLGIASLSTALAYVLYFRLLASAGATNLLLVTFLIPVSAIVLGAQVLGERLDASHVAGMGLIGLGLAAIDGRPLSWLRPRPAEPPR